VGEGVAEGVEEEEVEAVEAVAEAESKESKKADNIHSRSIRPHKASNPNSQCFSDLSAGNWIRSDIRD